MGYYRGFKAEAERLAMSTRRELDLSAFQRLDPWTLADHLSIPIFTLGDLVRRVPDMAAEIRPLVGDNAANFSAATVFAGTTRAIVHNQTHTLPRQASNICHELSHGLLLHPPTPLHDGNGCRNWNSDHEDEANFLAGALLIPARAAWAMAKRHNSLDEVAQQFGCSVDMARWRVNITGAGRLWAT